MEIIVVYMVIWSWTMYRTTKKKQVKVELDDSLNLIIMPGDGHCIANYFAVHFDTPLDTVLDLLQK